MNTPLIELKGKRIGLVGFGHIGQAMAKVALAFGMKVVVCPHKMDTKLPKEYEKAKLNDVFSTCDIVSLHGKLVPPVPDETRSNFD